MEYRLIRRRGQKNLRMHFNDKGELIVSCPYYVPLYEVETFINANREWINRNSSKIQNHSFSTGDKLFLLGNEYNLVVNQSSKDYLQIINNLFVVYAKNSEPEYVKKIICRHYENELKKYLGARVPYWCSRMNLAVPACSVYRASTRWGVCNKNRRLIKISIMTVTLPEDLIDMIVLHELCHLVYANHQDEFWNMMKNYMPDLDDRKRKLKAVSKLSYHRNLFH